MTTPNNLKRLIKIEDALNKIAEEYGLKFCPIEWDIIPDQKMFEIMAYRIPGNISNWKFGRDYERIRTINEQIYDGLPYEVVINSDPSRAYLMNSNTLGVQCLVMAHVIGHVSFFTMNKYFMKTKKDIIQVLDTAAKRFSEYEKNYGLDEVERIIDAGHALQFHSSPFDTEKEEIKKQRVFEMRKQKEHNISDSQFKDFHEKSEEELKMDINRYNQKLWRGIKQKTPIEPCGDLLRYIIDHSTILEDWQRDILEILRLEGQYFWPQIKTKYMNEGFATYWHQILVSRLYKEGLINNTEHAEYNYSNSLVKAKHALSMNPYLIGCKVWENIVERWDKGRHGREYDDCTNLKQKEEWDTKDGKGREKMFQTLSSYQDWFFMQDFLTPELVDELNMYIFVQRETPSHYEIVRTKHEAKEVRDLIVSSFAHSHIPQVEIEDINYEGAGKLHLIHRWAGADLAYEYAIKTMGHIYDLWGRDCILETIVNKQRMKITATAEAIGHEKIEDVEEQSHPGSTLLHSISKNHMRMCLNGLIF